MNQLAGTLSGLILGALVVLLICGLMDAGLGGLLWVYGGGIGGAVLGYRFGTRSDQRDQQQALEAIAVDPASLERLQQSQRVAKWTCALCVVTAVLIGAAIDLVNQHPRAFMPLAWVGVFASVPVMRITTRQTRWPRLLGTLTGLAFGAIAGALAVPARAAVVGAILGALVFAAAGYAGARLWSRTHERIDPR